MIRVSGDLIDDWLVVVHDVEALNPPEEQRKNKLNVLIQVRYRNAIKYITVFNQAFPIGMEFDGQVTERG
jgi:hypothetical protein